MPVMLSRQTVLGLYHRSAHFLESKRSPYFIFKNHFPRRLNDVNFNRNFLSNEVTAFNKEATIESSNMPLKVLNVAEKNDAAKSISELLARGRYTRKEGLSVYNKIYQFPYKVRGQACDMLMTSVSGHLLNYDFGDTYRKWNSCPAVRLFDLPVTKTCKEDSNTKIKKTL